MCNKIVVESLLDDGENFPFQIISKYSIIIFLSNSNDCLLIEREVKIALNAKLLTAKFKKLKVLSNWTGSLLNF